MQEPDENSVELVQAAARRRERERGPETLDDEGPTLRPAEETTSEPSPEISAETLFRS